MSNRISAEIFDRRLARLHRERAARMASAGAGMSVGAGSGAGVSVKSAHPLLNALAEEMADRLMGIKPSFRDVLELGGGGISVAALLRPDAQRNVVLCDLSESAARSAGMTEPAALPVVADEEALPFAEARFDLIVSLLSLSSVNDVQRHLLALKALLRPGGLFMAAMAGGESLADFRACLMEAELAFCGGAGSRFSPAIDMVSASRLLAQAGFTLPVVDRESCSLTYPGVFALIHDLRGLGMTAAHRARAREWLPRSVFAEAERIYRSRHKAAKERLAVKIELIFLHGWREA